LNCLRNWPNAFLTLATGDISGDYKKNPVEVGSENVDIVLNQVAT